MRLFIAVNFSPEICSRLIVLREELRSRSRSGNFTHDENLHLTLAFIGEVSLKQVDKIKAIMNTVSFDAFPVAINRLGTFSRGVKRGSHKVEDFVGRRSIAGRVSRQFFEENFEWISGLFGEMYTHLAAAFYYDKTDDVAVRGIYSGIVNAFKMYGLGFRVRMLDAPTLMWDFPSLKTAIEAIYGFYLTDPDRPLHKCKHCGKVFMSPNICKQINIPNKAICLDA